MSIVDQIMRELPIEQIASMIGTDPATAKQAAAGMIPVLMQQLTSNATTPEGAAGLAAAMQAHAEDDTTDITSIDPLDGLKMLGHIFGSEHEAEQAVSPQIQQLGGSLGSPMTRKLLSYIAPLVLAYIAKQITGQGKKATQQAPAGGSGDILGSILGSVLGGHAAQAPQQNHSGGTILSDVLGSILGGGMSQQAEPQAQAPANTNPGDGMPEMEYPQGAQAQQRQQPKSEGGLGGLLKDILGGGR